MLENIINKKHFDKAFKMLIGHEGGYVNDPLDFGGETKFGISKRAYPHVIIKDLTLHEAKLIYKADYWDILKLDGFKHFEVKYELFEIAVNMGTKTAVHILQRGLNLLNRNGKTFNDLAVDGIVGMKTLMAVRKVKKERLLKVINGLQFERYMRIVESNPEQERFFNGWINRV
jgi:lysozyme family protein